MFKDFNLLATTYRRLEGAACSELRHLLEKTGDQLPRIGRSGVSGLIVAKTVLDPLEAVEQLRKILIGRPYEFRYLLRIIPVETVVSTDMAEIEHASEELGLGISENETFRITVEKRLSEISKQDIIETVATHIKRQVDLDRPDKVLLIEVVGDLTGVSLIRPCDVINVLKEKVL